MKSEIDLVDQWLYSLFSSDAGLVALVGGEIINGMAAQGDGQPYVIWNYQGGSDVNALGGIRVMVNGTWQIKAVGQGSSNVPILPIAQKIDELLQRAACTLIDGYVFGCVRIQPIGYPENTPEGIQYRHLGGLYRIHAQGANQ